LHRDSFFAALILAYRGFCEKKRIMAAILDGRRGFNPETHQKKGVVVVFLAVAFLFRFFSEIGAEKSA
jgi:hypothetical protein